MYQSLARLNQAALRRPRSCIVAWLIVVAIASAFLPQIKLNASFRVFFNESDPMVHTLDKLHGNYSTGEMSAIMVATKEGDIFTRETLTAVEELTQAAWKLPKTIRVDSLNNFPFSRSTGDDIQVTELVENAAALTDTQLAQIRRDALSDALIRTRLISEDASATLVVVTFTPETGESLVDSMVIYKQAIVLRDQMRARYPDLNFHMTGVVAGNAAVTNAATRDGFVIIPLGMTCALLCMFWFLRRESGDPRAAGYGLIGALMVITVASLIPMGLMAAAGISANNVTAVIPVVILTLAVADSLHILVTYYQRMRAGNNRQQAMLESLRINAEPVWLTSATTMIGFLAMNFSESPPFQDMGNLVASGVFIAWLAANTLLPATILLLPASKTAATQDPDISMHQLAAWVMRHYRLILCTGMVTLAVGISCVPLNRINESWITYLSDSTDFGADTGKIVERFRNLNEIEFDIPAGGEGGVYKLPFLLQLEQFSDWLRSQPEVRFVQSVDGTLKRLNKNMHGDDPAYYRMPDTEAETAQLMLLYAMSLPYGSSVDSDINMNRSATRLVIGLKSSDTAYHLGVQKRIQDWLRANTPDLYHPGTGLTSIMSSLAHRDAKGMVWGSALALLLISLSIALVFRSIQYGLISALVNTIPAVIAFGIWGLLVGQVGLSVSIVFSASIGIIVDYCLHFMSKYRRAKYELNLSTEQAIEYAYSTVGVALLVTTAVLVINFGILGLSQFRVNIYMGLLTAMTISLAFLSQLFFLPALLLLLDRLHIRLDKPKDIQLSHPAESLPSDLSTS